MKISLSIISLVFLINGYNLAQEIESEKKSIYGIELNQFVTGSGFASGSEILLSVSEGRRCLNIGFYYCPESKRISGIIAHHEISLVDLSKTLAPYLFYNGVFRITKLNNQAVDTNAVIGFGRYKTFEHHIGIGLRYKITKAIYLSSSIGYGIYFGSIKKPTKLPYTNEIIGTNGFSPIGKLGFGIIF